MKKNNKISEAELEIMKVIWEAGEPVPSTDIVRRLKDKCGWEDTTIYTMLSKLVKKGVLIRDKKVVSYYSASLTEQDYMLEQTESLVDRLFAGDSSLFPCLWKTGKSAGRISGNCGSSGRRMMNEFLLLLLSMSLSGTLLALLLFLLRPLLKRNLSRAWMYYIWCIVALRMLLPHGRTWWAVCLRIRQPPCGSYPHYPHLRRIQPLPLCPQTRCLTMRFPKPSLRKLPDP